MLQSINNTLLRSHYTFQWLSDHITVHLSYILLRLQTGVLGVHVHLKKKKKKWLWPTPAEFYWYTSTKSYTNLYNLVMKT